VSIRAVAERVGVTPPSIYLHFLDKGNLLEAVCAAAFASLDSRLAGAAAGHDEPVAALRAIGRAYVEFALERPEHYRFMFMRRPEPGLLGPTEAELESTAGLSRVIEAIRAAQRRGAIDPQRSPAAVAYSLWAAVHGIVALLIAKPHFPWGDREAVVESVLDMCLDGVTSR
jgi:AcrR family transcriptional regulator